MNDQKTPEALHKPEWAINLQGDISPDQIATFRGLLAERDFHAIVCACEGLQVIRLGADLPSVAYRPELEQVGGASDPRYIAKLGPVLGEGLTPAAAMAAFDEAWHKPAELEDLYGPPPGNAIADVEELFPLSVRRAAQLQELTTRYRIIGCKVVVNRTSFAIEATVTLSAKLAEALGKDPITVFRQPVSESPATRADIAFRHDVAALDLCKGLHANLDRIRAFA